MGGEPGRGPSCGSCASGTCGFEDGSCVVEREGVLAAKRSAGVSEEDFETRSCT